MTTTQVDAECGITAAAGHPDEPTDANFRFWITPHRSMTDRGFALFIFATITVAIAGQLAFLALGAWMAGFGVLFDGLFLAAAFVACRSDRKRVEKLSLRNGILYSERRKGNGEVIASSEIPAFGLELIRTNDPDYGLQKVECRHRSKTVEIGCELSPAERMSFADAFEASLVAHGFRPRISQRTLPSTAAFSTQD